MDPVPHKPLEGTAGSTKRPPGAGHALLFGVKRVPRGKWVWAAICGAVVVAGALVLVFTHVDWTRFMDVVAQLPIGLLLPAMALLPLIGFPIVPVYLVAGARFGPYGGGLVVALVTAAHLAGSYLIAQTVLRRPLLRLLRRWHAHLPEIPDDEQVAVAFIAVLVPGIPYVLRNYLLAVIGLRLRIYFWIALPIHVARSYVSILVGNLGTAPDRSQFLVLLAIEALKVVICAIVIWRLREHHRRVHGEPTPGG